VPLMSAAPEKPTGRLEKIRKRIQARDAVFLRTAAHVAIWVAFGVVLAVAPFAVAWFIQHPDQRLVWAKLVPSSELILISIAIGAGAFGELALRTFLSPELTFKIGTKIAYLLVAIIICVGTYRFATVYGHDEEQTPAARGWTAVIVLFSLLAAAITITVNERAELYVRIREKEDLEDANKELATTKEQLTTANEQLTTAKDQLTTANNELAKLGQPPIEPARPAATENKGKPPGTPAR
jgi:hypothetical protein